MGMKKISEMSLIELKAELERRGINKIGDRNLLLMKLRKALKDEKEQQLKPTTLGTDSKDAKNEDETIKNAEDDKSSKTVIVDDDDDDDVVFVSSTRDVARTKDSDYDSEKPDEPVSLWIANLPLITKAADLKELCYDFGIVTCAKVKMNTKGPEPKCFGVVTLTRALDADHCIETLNQTKFKGRVITVERATPEQLSKSKHSEEAKSKANVPVISSTEGNVSSTLNKSDSKLFGQKNAGPNFSGSNDQAKGSKFGFGNESREYTLQKMREEREYQRKIQQERQMREDERRRQYTLEREQRMNREPRRFGNMRGNDRPDRNFGGRQNSDGPGQAFGNKFGNDFKRPADTDEPYWKKNQKKIRDDFSENACDSTIQGYGESDQSCRDEKGNMQQNYEFGYNAKGGYGSKNEQCYDGYETTGQGFGAGQSYEYDAEMQKYYDSIGKNTSENNYNQMYNPPGQGSSTSQASGKVGKNSGAGQNYSATAGQTYGQNYGTTEQSYGAAGQNYGSAGQQGFGTTSQSSGTTGQSFGTSGQNYGEQGQYYGMYGQYSTDKNKPDEDLRNAGQWNSNTSQTGNSTSYNATFQTSGSAQPIQSSEWKPLQSSSTTQQANWNQGSSNSGNNLNKGDTAEAYNQWPSSSVQTATTPQQAGYSYSYPPPPAAYPAGVATSNYPANSAQQQGVYDQHMQSWYNYTPPK